MQKAIRAYFGEVIRNDKRVPVKQRLLFGRMAPHEMTKVYNHIEALLNNEIIHFIERGLEHAAIDILSSQDKRKQGNRRKRTQPPKGYDSWRQWMEKSGDKQAGEILELVQQKYGADREWLKHVSPTNLLRQYMHPVMLQADKDNEA